MSTDPTKTKTLRSEHEAEYYNRFRQLKGQLRTAIVERDTLHLGAQQARNAQPNPRDYKFLSDAEKRKRFEAWLGKQIDDGVLVVENPDSARQGNHYSAPYIRKAYAKGVRHAGIEARKQGVDVDEESLNQVFNAPVHRQKLEQLHTRVFENLNGITSDMSDEIGDELATALSEGKNPRRAASAINDRVDKVGLTRARLLARTEIIHAHAEGTLDRLGRDGFEQVTADVEFSTAGDSRVCSICASLGGNTYTLEEARGRLPVHPQCRCAWLPITADSE
jgi:SPP1 gp7 family putative phage head morphogenesis protein